MGNLNFGLAKRKTFTIDGDESRVISLDVSDTGILSRLHDIQEFLETSDKFVSDMNEKTDNPDLNDWKKSKLLSEAFADRDKAMREKLNYLFDTDVCTPICGNGSVYRMVNGEMLYNLILEQLLPLYEAEIAKQTAASSKRIAKHTAKYVTPEQKATIE